MKWTTEALDGIPDPEDDAGWAYWIEHGWQQDSRDAALCYYTPSGSTRANADFIAAHWTPVNDDSCACDAYDREAGLCTAQDSKPPVCSSYPWYGREPDGGTGMPLQCSYLADLPPEKRPEGARPLIPLTVVSRHRVPA